MKEYITKDGDRWDLLAWEFYGDPYLYVVLLEANPDLKHYSVLPSGKKLKVPIVYIDEASEVSPPWQRD
ncbi:tail protein X [Sulfurihydrogenibium sp.]|uniref:tail protein X n=1 Tax=Sulfurihydrogenibium sp. TaxID=2053621 RepID=UPI002625CDB4|nr:tail protein X [Sulfurihydrogenibium sp.]